MSNGGCCGGCGRGGGQIIVRIVCGFLSVAYDRRRRVRDVGIVQE